MYKQAKSDAAELLTLEKGPKCVAHCSNKILFCCQRNLYVIALRYVADKGPNKHRALVPSVLIAVRVTCWRSICWLDSLFALTICYTWHQSSKRAKKNHSTLGSWILKGAPNANPTAYHSRITIAMFLVGGGILYTACQYCITLLELRSLVTSANFQLIWHKLSSITGVSLFGRTDLWLA